MREMECLCQRLPPVLANAVHALTREQIECLEEIRIYAGGRAEFVIGGRVCEVPVRVLMEELLACLSAHALYSCERQMAQGYIPLPGGHRAGVCGRMTRTQDGAWRMANVTSVCIRFGRCIQDVSLPIRPFLLDEAGHAQRVLVLGAPGSGKTTLLRDAALWLTQKGLHVAVSDEREELFGCGEDGEYGRLSVLSGMDKACAFSMLLRVMAPQVIISDELGRAEDAPAVLDCVRCGVGLLVSAHAGSMEEALGRPVIRRLFDEKAFDWYVQLSRRSGVAGIYDSRACRWEGKEFG